MRRSAADTRATILAAARDRFATDGYERTTIRAVARDAAIDPSMVMRYFGSKEGLFAAAADVDLGLPDLAEVPAADRGAALVAHLLRRWEQDGGLRVLLRTAGTTPAAAQRVREVFAGQLVPLVPGPGGADARRRAGLVATQVLGLALCRYVLELPPVAQLDGAELVALVGPTLQRYLDGELG